MRDQKQAFLEAIDERVHRYQPILESTFDVSLGGVRPHEIRTREWLDRVLQKGESEWQRRFEAKNRKPSAIEATWHRSEVALVRRLALPVIAFRFWWPDFIMMWDDELHAVCISFSGWSRSDYAANRNQLDQYVVHELAHGVWDALGEQRDSVEETWREWRAWRNWNEGFCHFIADAHFVEHYPEGYQLHEDWSSFRIRARQRVADLVEECGAGVLRDLPGRWREFERRRQRVP